MDGAQHDGLPERQPSEGSPGGPFGAPIGPPPEADVSWHPPVPGSSWAPHGGAVPPPLPATEIALQPTEPVAPRRRGRRIAAIAAATALIAAGAFAVTSIASGDEGGADSPKQAVQHLADALSHGDLLGAMDVLLPGERETIRQPMLDITKQLQRLEVLQASAALDHVTGSDSSSGISIHLGTLDVDQVAPDIATVAVSGDASIHTKNRNLPLGKLLLDEFFDGKKPTGGIDQELSFGGRSGDPLQLTTVQKGGRWYVSIWYSVAERIRDSAGLDAPGAKEAVVPKGAAKPEEAVDHLVSAIGALDLEKAIATLNPNEFDALQRYAPLFIDDAQKSLNTAKVKIAITDAKYDVESRGDGKAAVGIEHLTVKVTSDPASGSSSLPTNVTVTFDGKCLTLTQGSGAPEKGCKGDKVDVGAIVDDTTGSANSGDDPFGSSSATTTTTDPGTTDSGTKSASQAALVAGATALSGTHPIFVQQVKGQWYVSVFGSVFDGIVRGLEGLDKGTLKKDLDSIKKLFDGRLSASDLPGISSIPGVDGPTTTDGSFTTDDPFGTDPSNTDPSNTDGTDSTEDPQQRALDDCYAVSNANAGIACVEAGIKDGTIDPTAVTAAVRFPECGIAVGWWTSYKDVPDAAFTQEITAAHDCFQQKVASGAMHPEDVPYEAVSPSCFGGKNPYLLDGDAFDTAMSKYDDCVAA